MKNINRAFSIIEIIIGIFIFSLGISAIYMVISSSLNMNIYNQNQIIAGNLAREGIELVRNIRDSNYITYHKWNQKGPYLDYTNTDNFFSTGSYYIVENDYSEYSQFPIKVTDITTGFGEGVENLTGSMENYRLCLDSEKRYTYDCSTSGNKKTQFYRYIKFDEVKYNSGTNTELISDAYKVNAKVIWYMKGYHEIQIDTILADWKRL
ncbi:MAG: hypothetical protein PHH06_01815 [Candidatus Gracilibacteria bacterium]|nr:hypothetical protein [Candidatus Gracilibacteria bacterium]